MVLSNYTLGWKEEFLRYPGLRLEYTPLDLMWKAAKYSGLNERYPHFYAKSGYFSFFLYDLERFWIYDIFRVPLVQNSLNGCNVRHAIFEPKTIDEAASFIYEMINTGNLVWATHYEPILIFGVEGEGGMRTLHFYNSNIAPKGATWGLDELDAWWAQQESLGAHVLISPMGIAGGINTEEEILMELAKLAVTNFNASKLDFAEDITVPLGLAAYDAYMTDLRDPKIDFLKPYGENQAMMRTTWFSFAIYSQWTQYFAAHAYFQNNAQIFPTEQQVPLYKAAEAYAKAYGHWLEWEQTIGRTSDGELFARRLADMKARESAAEKVELARDSVLMAVMALGEFLELRGIDPDSE